MAKSSVDLYARRPGAICRTFVRSESSPSPEEFERVQGEYDVVCKWMHDFAKSLPASRTTLVGMEEIKVPQFPDVTNEVLRQTDKERVDEFENFNWHVRTFKAMEARSRHTEFEDFLGYIGPFLIALALALRVTKVTGELMMEVRG